MPCIPKAATVGRRRARRSDGPAGGGRRASSPAPSSAREAQIGRGTRIAAGAVIGYRVTIGRDCYIGPLRHARARPGRRPRHRARRRRASARTASASPWARGATSRCRRSAGSSSRTTWRSAPTAAIDRGALKDTIIGEGTKIDNLVQIGHNVVIGRHCVIVAQTGISGSTELGDFVVMGGQSGTVGPRQDRRGRPDRRDGPCQGGCCRRECAWAARRRVPLSSGGARSPSWRG